MTKIKICHAISYSNRNSRPEVFCKKEVLEIFVKFKGKHLCQSLFFDKVAELGYLTTLQNTSM